ncbi:MAG: helix-turn-helix domain-containing protein [Halodesulfurarchaeum sp.]
MSSLASEATASEGIRAKVRLADLENCPIAEVSDDGVECFNVSKRVDPETGRVTEEFATDASVELPDGTFEPVFSYGQQSVYRFQRNFGHDCACELVEGYDCPIVDIQAEAGDLSIVFHAPSIDDLRGAITALRESYDDVDVQRLVSSREDEGSEDLVFVDRGVLTDRQREVLEVAHEMGYFEHPKGANAGQVAAELGITTSTFTEHLAAAQSKLLESILEEPEATTQA